MGRGKLLFSMIARRRFSWSIFFFLGLTFGPLASAEERIVGEGEHRGFLVHDGEQIFKVSPIKPGQTLHVFVSPQWSSEKGGRVEWILADQNEVRLKTARHHQPEDEPILLEWTANSEPRPSAYRLYIRGRGGNYAGEILGQYNVQVSLWDQNDGNSGTDAPESYEKALELAVSEPGTHLFDECFLSGTADLFDVYMIFIKPNHSLTLKANPLQWNGTDQRGKVRWEFLSRTFRRMKEGQSSFADTSPFVIKVFHPQVKSSTKPAIFYLLVKIEGEVSLIYSLEADMREGR